MRVRKTGWVAAVMEAYIVLTGVLVVHCVWKSVVKNLIIPKVRLTRVIPEGRNWESVVF